jgi:hypothetical protein
MATAQATEEFMRVTDARLIRLRDACQLEAWVTLESIQSDPFLLWYRFPLDYITAVSAGLNDAFVAALLTPAMALGERLSIEGVVSARLMQSLPLLQAIYQEWNAGLSIISVDSSGLDHSAALKGRARRVGLFFSLGVDSFYSLLKNSRDHPDDEMAIDDLLFVRGLDIAIDQPKVDELFAKSVRNARRVADQFRKTLLIASTNLRNFTNRFVSWGKTCHGAALASIALALGERLREVKIASTYDWEHLFPWGSHPQLDPLWSNGKVVLTHDGCEATRLDKTRLVAEHPIALETLRVCYENPDSIYNCGRCQKCLLTMVELQRCGALERCRTFPQNPRIKDILEKSKGIIG